MPCPSCIVPSPFLSNPPPHGGGGHGGGHHGGGRPHGGHPSFRGGLRNGRWGVPQLTSETFVESTCTAWGFPAPMNPDLDFLGKRLIAENRGQPARAYYNGVLHLFSFVDGVIRAQPCARTVAVTSTLSGPPTLYYLYRRIAPGAGWSVMGGWLSLADAKDEMTQALVEIPTSEFGAYEWDGQTMIWKFL